MTPEDYLFYANLPHLEEGTDVALSADFTFARERLDEDQLQHWSETAQPTKKRTGPRGGVKPLRPRQQQLCALQEELEKRMLELKHAQEEGERLRQRIKILEVVLPIREQQAAILKQYYQAGSLGRVQRSDPTGLTLHTQSLAAFNTQAPHLVITELRSSPSSGSCSGLITDLPERSIPAQPPADVAAPSTYPNISMEPDTAQVAVGGRARAAAEDGHPLPYSALKASTRAPPHVVSNLMSIWNTWVRDVGLVLHAHDARPHDPGPQLRLMQLRDQMLVRFSARKMEYPLLVAEIMSLNLETGQREEPPPESFWVPVAQAMQFTPEQVVNCQAALSLYQERIAKVLSQRQCLVDQLSASLAAMDMAPPLGLQAPQRPCGAGPAVLQCGQALVDVEDVTLQLYRNVRAEGHLLDLVKDFLGSSLFTLVQMSRACVLAYPYFPDPISLVSTVVALAGQPATAAPASAATHSAALAKAV